MLPCLALCSTTVLLLIHLLYGTRRLLRPFVIQFAHCLCRFDLPLNRQRDTPLIFPMPTEPSLEAHPSINNLIDL